MKAANKTLHRTAILLHPITADELGRLQCKFCIYREEKNERGHRIKVY